MVTRNSHGRDMSQQRFSQSAFAYTFALAGAPKNEVESGLTTVMEEDSVDDQSSDDRRDPDKSLDIRDLLLDETD